MNLLQGWVEDQEPPELLNVSIMIHSVPVQVLKPS